jgi:hypothetical protein
MRSSPAWCASADVPPTASVTGQVSYPSRIASSEGKVTQASVQHLHTRGHLLQRRPLRTGTSAPARAPRSVQETDTRAQQQRGYPARGSSTNLRRGHKRSKRSRWRRAAHQHNNAPSTPPAACRTRQRPQPPPARTPPATGGIPVFISTAAPRSGEMKSKTCIVRQWQRWCGPGIRRVPQAEYGCAQASIAYGVRRGLKDCGYPTALAHPCAQGRMARDRPVGVQVVGEYQLGA